VQFVGRDIASAELRLARQTHDTKTLRIKVPRKDYSLLEAGENLFVSLLCITAYSMSHRLAGLGITGDLPTHLVLYIVLVLVPQLPPKICAPPDRHLRR
jgi:hypothetical protein